MGKKYQLNNLSANSRIDRNAPFQVVESYKTLRANLVFSLSAIAAKTILISSYEPGVGKSTVSGNLAITFAQTGAKVLLIDADMRKPSLHRVFEKANQHGLSHILGGVVKTSDALLTQVVENLDFIPAGPLPPNPSELLSSEHMTEFLAASETDYDYIIIDTPPIGVISDALTLISHNAGVVLIARQNKTRYDMLQKALESVEQVNGKLLGVVLNDTKPQRRSYHHSFYGYRYGEVPTDVD